MISIEVCEADGGDIGEVYARAVEPPGERAGADPGIDHQHTAG